MSLFDSLGGAAQQPQSNSRFTPTAQEAQRLRDARQQFNADPVGILRSCGLNIPDGMNDPMQIAMHLFRSGQIGRNGRMVRR